MRQLAVCPPWPRTATRPVMVSNPLTDALLRSATSIRLSRFAMLIVCPSCATSYQVEPHSLGQEGRSVRCARCQNVWFASVSSSVPTVAGADAWDVIDTGPRVPAIDGRPALDGARVSRANADDTDPLPSGIDLTGLSADLDVARAEQEAEADAILAEVTAETVPPEPSSRLTAETVSEPAPNGGADIETLAARRFRRDQFRARTWMKPLPMAIAALVAVNAGILAWRSDIVRVLPQTASFYAAIGLPVNLRGLAFDNVRMSRAENEGVGVLVVEGSIVNVTSRPVEVPRLRLALRNTAKNEVYAWTALPGRAILAPGEALPFRSRLASPPADASDVQVRFFSRRDLLAGLN